MGNNSTAKQTLHEILAKYRAASKTEREKGTYFEELIRTYRSRQASTITTATLAGAVSAG